jgi:hypothetical protein
MEFILGQKVYVAANPQSNCAMLSLFSHQVKIGESEQWNADNWFDWRNELGKYCCVLPPVE